MLRITVANQKGGTGKTTTTLILSYLLAKRGYDVLAVDLDPQASLTLALGYDPDEVDGIDIVFKAYLNHKKRRNILKAEPTEPEIKLGDIIVKVNFMDASFHLAPARPSLEEYNLQLGAQIGGTKILSKVLGDCEYDVVLIDTQPTLSKLVETALVAADKVLAPVELSYLSLGGFTLLLNTVAEVRDEYNLNLDWLGILPVKFEKRNKDSQINLDKLKNTLSDIVKIYPPVPKSVSLERMISQRMPIDELLKKIKSAKDVLATYDIVVNDICKIISR